MTSELTTTAKFNRYAAGVRSVDLHPTEPLIMASLTSGAVRIWNYKSQAEVKSFQVTIWPVRSAKFVAREHWVVAGADDMFIRVYNYNTMDEVKVYKAHTACIRCVAVHPTLSYVLSSSDDMLIKLWDWQKGWVCTREFKGHLHNVMQVTFNPKDTNTFASASLDRTIKIWSLGSPDPNFTLYGHQKGVNCVDYFTGGDKFYLITGSDDHTAKVWDYQAKSCVQTLEGHTQNVSAVCFHPELPIIITSSEDCNVSIWHSTTYRLVKTLPSCNRVWDVGYVKGSRRFVIGYDQGIVMVKLCNEVTLASMDNSGKIIWIKNHNIQTVNIKNVGADFEVFDGERLILAVQDLEACDFSRQSLKHSLKHSPDGRFVGVCGGGKYTIYTVSPWEVCTSGSASEFVWSSEGEYAVREYSSKIKIFSKDLQEKKSIQPTFSAERIFGGTLLAICTNEFVCFYDWECRLIRKLPMTVKNLYWADSGDLVTIACCKYFFILKYEREVFQSHVDRGEEDNDNGFEDAFSEVCNKNERVRSGLWVGEYFVYTNSSHVLNYCVDQEVRTIYHLDRPMYLLGYLASQSLLLLIDNDYNVVGYSLPLGLIEFNNLLICGDNVKAFKILPTLSQEHRNSAAHFLESRGMIDDALAVATDPDYRYDLGLAIQLRDLSVAMDVATEVPSESKWKQLGEIAMSTGKLEMAETCMKHAMDLSGLLLLYSSLGDAKGMSELAALSKEQGKNNVAFQCLFMLGKVEDCIDLLVESNRIPEAAFMARSYLPSKVSEILAIWRKDLDKVNPKAAESLADPAEYPNLFDDWQLGLSIESKSAESRGSYPPAKDYVNQADRSGITLVEAFRKTKIDGDVDHEEGNEQNGHQVEQNGEEDAIVVNADYSTDGGTR